jgi:hypothetical protein
MMCWYGSRHPQVQTDSSVHWTNSSETILRYLNPADDTYRLIELSYPSLSATSNARHIQLPVINTPASD